MSSSRKKESRAASERREADGLTGRQKTAADELSVTPDGICMPLFREREPLNAAEPGESSCPQAAGVKTPDPPLHLSISPSSLGKYRSPYCCAETQNRRCLKQAVVAINGPIASRTIMTDGEGREHFHYLENEEVRVPISVSDQSPGQGEDLGDDEEGGIARNPIPERTVFRESGGRDPAPDLVSDDEEQSPYPTLAPVVFFCVKQTTRPSQLVSEAGL
ncbi:hypothetical protein SKAU_G00293790 [Synaphobranchus kaupii]|uniref:Uncharacterized protein n=1 Tax=Synaphobranchus kaupii TaxID=118154 RepID=A0A9Q1EUA6_SYNKA|nr:hypothetical protein SKAU_G00293790 [Synaphobranchus kaupii]